MAEEILDVVDGNDQIVGQTTKAYFDLHSLNPGNYVRAVNAFVENSQGQLWIPRRSAIKRAFPSALDIGVSGAVASGETYEDAFARETQEEINCSLADLEYTFVGYLSPVNYDISAFMQVYKIFLDEAPEYNPDDFSQYYWLTPEQVLERIAQGDSSKSDLPKLIRIVYEGRL